MPFKYQHLSLLSLFNLHTSNHTIPECNLVNESYRYSDELIKYMTIVSPTDILIVTSI